MSLWGSPSDPSHDAQRGDCAESFPAAQMVEREAWEAENKATGHIGREPGYYRFDCPTEASDTAFLTMPSSCPAQPLLTSIGVESWADPKPEDALHAASSSPPPTGCAALPFEPTIKLHPEATTTSSATGLSFDLHVPQNETLGTLAEANLKSAVVTLPAGLTVNPATAGGRQACPLLTGTEATKEQAERKKEIVGIDFQSAAPANCPDASELGTVEVDTPLLDHPLPGTVYRFSSPFGGELAVREVDLDAGAAEVDHGDEGVGGVEAVGAVGEQADLAVQALQARV